MSRDSDAVFPVQARDACYWLTSGQFAGVSEVSERAAKKALLRATEGHAWNGARLVVRKQGRVYLVDARSLPERLYRKFYDANREALAPAPVAASATELPNKKIVTDPQWAATQYRIAEWLAGIIAPALAFARNSHGRGEVLRFLAEQTVIHPENGKPLRIKEGTLRAYCRRFEEGGVHALMRKERKVEERPRVMITRKWQQACPLPLTIKEKLAQEMELHIRGLWAAGAPSRDKVRHMASAELARRCRDAGWEEASIRNCDVGQYLVESTQDTRRVAVAEKNAKHFADRMKPRIMRDRRHLKPGECIVGDVHPVDVLLRRADGSTYTPRMIAWYDAATNRCFSSLVHCDPGRSVTQADVTRSFVDMCSDWGIPRTLYLDNGTEFSWDAMVDGFKALAGMGCELDLRIAQLETLEAQWREEDQGGDGTSLGPPKADSMKDAAVVRANPYNAAAKPVEGGFSAQEKVFSMMPGYIGGDRMNKRVSKVGCAPDTYPGTVEGFDQEFAEAMAMFHALPQRGLLNGKSPNQAYAAVRHLDMGIKTEPVVFLLAFSEEQTLKVRTQGVQVGGNDGGKWYYNDALLPLIGKRCRFRVAKWRKEAIVLVEGSGGNTRYTAIHEARAYGFFDREGAKEASRREGVSKRHIRGLRGAAPKVDLRDAQRTYVEEAGRCMPDVSSMPEPQERRIGLSEGLKALSDQLSGTNLNPVEKLAPGEFVDGEGVVRRLSRRKDILKNQQPATSSPAFPELKAKRPGPPLKPLIDFEEHGRKAQEEARAKRRAGQSG